MTTVCGIYCLTHIESGFKYVGQSRNIAKRWLAHSKGSGKTRIARSVFKHGWAAFSTEILEVCSPETLNSQEAHWIFHLKCMSPNGLNLRSGGGQRSFCSAETIAKLVIAGTNPSAETRAKISLANKGRVLTAETRSKMAAARTGVKRSPEMCLKLSVIHKGKNITAETRLKISNSKIGTTHTPEAKAKISLASKARMTDAGKANLSAKLKGRPRSTDSIAKAAAANKGMTRSNEAKAKMSAAQKGKKQSPETIAKRVATKAKTMLLRQNAAITSTSDLFSQVA